MKDVRAEESVEERRRSGEAQRSEKRWWQSPKTDPGEWEK